MHKFERGDLVTWTSQSAGSVKTKTGIVMDVIPAGSNRVKDCIPNCGIPRNHVSYLVSVSGKLYWPLVKLLRPYDVTDFEPVRATRTVVVEAADVEYLLSILRDHSGGKLNGVKARIRKALK